MAYRIRPANNPGGQFIYASTVIRYVKSPKHNPHERLRDILGISATKSGEDPFAELDALYRVLMSSVVNLSVAIEILGIHLDTQYREIQVQVQETLPLAGCGNRAPLASVLKYEG